MAKATTVDATPVKVLILTLDTHLATATTKAWQTLVRELPGLELTMHAASAWTHSPALFDRVKADLEAADIVVCTMLFLEDHFLPLLPLLEAKRGACDALVCVMSAGEVAKLTLMGGFDMGKPASGPLAFLKKLRGNSKDKAAGASQMKMLRRLPQILRFVPGVAQDVRAYFMTMLYWLGGSEDNMVNLVRFLVHRYAAGPRKALRAKVNPAAPVEYPEVGVYHPKLQGRLSEEASALPKQVQGTPKGRVGVLVMRSYLLAGNTRHYDAVIAALEAQGLEVVPAFASGLDNRPAIEKFFIEDGRATVDAMVSLSGFSLVGGPAYNDAKAAEEMLAKLDVPYIAAHPVEFQTLEQWGGSDRGLLPVESTIMVSIPELDGSTVPMVYGGRPGPAGSTCAGCERACVFPKSATAEDMFPCAERTEMLAARVAKLVALRRMRQAERKVAVVLFNFPPNAGNIGTAAYLAVFESLFNTLEALKAEGYTVDMPADVDALRDSIVNGNRSRFGTDANVHTQIGVDDHVRREKYLKEIEQQWGPAPGKQLSNGRSIFVLGKQFGNVLVSVQPAFGYEGDPMRLLFEKGWAPTHAFSAYYRYLREDFAASVVLHFGTHGALEFMPGKQVGLSGACWPERMIGALPNVYLYASNNPSEGAIAKRRSGATLVSYLTPPVAQAGLYKGLEDLKSSLQRYLALEPERADERKGLIPLIQSQAADLELAKAEPAWASAQWDREVTRLGQRLIELEQTLIPHGLHVVGQASSLEERIDMLAAMSDGQEGNKKLPREVVEALVETRDAKAGLARAGLAKAEREVLEAAQKLVDTDALLREETELGALMRALDGRFIRPAPGGDVVRTPEVLPTGRNLHGFDPFRIPSAFAVLDGAQQAEKILACHMEAGNPLPESIALVLWGSDNLKSEGAQLAQAMALMGARPRFDSYGRLAGATLIPLEELGRPRIDVVMTLSGIFRDLMPLQIKLLAESSFLAASAVDEPIEQNFVRKHALAYQKQHGCDLETASLRVFGNADGAYGANVGNLVESGKWGGEDELAETYVARKGFAYGRSGVPKQQTALLNSALADVALTYQNLDSIELGVTTIDTYFDTLGGITRAVKKAKGSSTETPVYIGDQTKGEGVVRTLSEQVSLETHTRMLNPKWYEGMLKHGYEGVRQIEVHVTNTMGWSATTGQVQPWVYQKLSETFLLDPAMRERLAELNPTASARVANRLIEASERNYWKPDAATLEALMKAGEELEDRLEGLTRARATAA